MYCVWVGGLRRILELCTKGMCKSSIFLAFILNKRDSESPGGIQPSSAALPNAKAPSTSFVSPPREREGNTCHFIAFTFHH